MLKIMEKPFPLQTYKIDLTRQHRLCELNYQRLLRLLPELSELDHHELTIDYGTSEGSSGVSVSFDIIQRSPYTTLMHIQMDAQWGGWLSMPSFEIRLYHDVRMAEVVFRKHSEKLDVKYSYPNQKMHQPDEKEQWNRFLADFLEFCLHGGIVSCPVSINLNP